MLGGVPIRVSKPPIKAATARGISNLEGLMRAFQARLTTTGRKIAAAPAELINAESSAAASMITTSSVRGLAPAIWPMCRLRATATPCLHQPAPHHKQPGDDQHRGIGKPGQRLGRAEDAAEGQGQQRQDCRQIQAQTIAEKRRMTTISRAKTKNMAEVIRMTPLRVFYVVAMRKTSYITSRSWRNCWVYSR